MSTPTQVICPTCKSCSSAIRVSRRGFLQRFLYVRVGYYPWKCGACGCSFLYRSRGKESSSAVRHRAHG